MFNPSFLPACRVLLLEHVLSADLQNFQRIQLLQRHETDLCQLLNPHRLHVQLLNPHRLHLQVFCSAPWSKPLHDGFGAAAVCPNYNFDRSCSLAFQQVFHAHRFNATLRDRLGL